MQQQIKPDDNEKKALEKLNKNNQIICKSSNKGGNIVMMDRGQYMEMVVRLLNDREIYDIVDQNSMQKFLCELKTLLLKAKEDLLISEDEFRYL